MPHRRRHQKRKHNFGFILTMSFFCAILLGATMYYVLGSSFGSGQTLPSSTPNPTVMPTPTPSWSGDIDGSTSTPPVGNNLELFPNDWGGYSQGYGMVYTTRLPVSQPQITSYDTSVYHTAGAGSARIDVSTGANSATENKGRELDGNMLSVSPGDRIIFSCWIRTLTDSSTTFYPQTGGRIGIDFYAGARIQGKQSNGQTFYPNENNNAVINDWVCNSNGGTWQLRVIDIIVPATLTADGVPIPQGTQVAPTAIIPWMQAGPYDSTSSPVWFADPQVTVTHLS